MESQTPLTTTRHPISKLCPECGGERILYNVGPQLTSYSTSSKVDTSRQFWTCICTTCGHTTFYLKEPEKPPTKKMSQPLSNK